MTNSSQHIQDQHDRNIITYELLASTVALGTNNSSVSVPETKKKNLTTLYIPRLLGSYWPVPCCTSPVVENLASAYSILASSRSNSEKWLKNKKVQQATS